MRQRHRLSCEAYSLGEHILNHNIIKETDTKQVIYVESQSTHKQWMLSPATEFYSLTAG